MSKKFDEVFNRDEFRNIPGGWLQMFAGSGGDDDKDQEIKDLKAEIKELRQEAAKWRNQLRETEKERDELKAAAEKAGNETKAAKEAQEALLKEVRGLLKLDDKADAAAIKEAITKLQEAPNAVTLKAQAAMVKSAFLAAAGRFHNPEAAYQLAVANGKLANIKADLETLTVFPVDKDGKRIQKDGKDVVGVDSVIEDLAKEHRYLVKTASSMTPSNPPGGGTGNETPKTLAQAIAAKLAAQTQSS